MQVILPQSVHIDEKLLADVNDGPRNTIVPSTSDAPHISCPAHTGPLFKRGHKYGHWKKRWFCLQDSVLLCYRECPDSRPVSSGGRPNTDEPGVPFDRRVKKRILLQDCAMVGEAKVRKRRNMFGIVLHTGKTYYFIAPTFADMQGWLKALRECLKIETVSIPISAEIEEELEEKSSSAVNDGDIRKSFRGAASSSMSSDTEWEEDEELTKALVASELPLEKLNRLHKIKTVTSEQKVLKQGYMKKSSSLMSTRRWKLRWLVLRNDRLMCYKNEKEYELKKMIDMRHCLLVERIETRRSKFVMKITATDKIFAFKAQNRNELDAWVNAVDHAIKQLQVGTST